MSLVNDQKAYGIKSLLVKLTHTHGLDHGDDEILLDVESVPLDTADGGAWTKMLNTVPPLIRQELFVNDDHGSNF